MNKAENIEKAIEHLEQVLRVYINKKDKPNKAEINSKLAMLYYQRLHGHKFENYELAIFHCREALRFFKKKSFKTEWAELQYILGLAHSDRLAGEKNENIEKSMYYYRNALKVFIKEDYLLKWVEIQSCIAISYADRPFLNRINSIEKAIAHYEIILNNLKSEQASVIWAQIHANLGAVYRKRQKGNAADNIDMAIYHYQWALKVLTYENNPILWAACQNNLGTAFRARINGQKAENINIAINHLTNALSVRKKELDPEKWAETQMNLAVLLLDKAENFDLDKSSDNIKQSIDLLESLLEYFSKDVSPITWAKISLNLGTGYLKLSEKENADKHLLIEKCLFHYKNSLEILSPSNYPNDCLRLATKVARLFSESNDWHSATKYYDLAIDADEYIYLNAISESSKEIQLETDAHLYEYASFSHAKNGNLHKAVEIIEKSRTRLFRDKYNKNIIYAKPSNKDDESSLFLQLDKATKKLGRIQNLQSPIEKVGVSSADFKYEIEAQEAIHKEIQTLLAKIRELPNFKYFMSSLPAKDIQAIASNTLPLIYVLTTEFGGLALIVLPDRILPIWLKNLTQDSLMNLLMDGTEDETRFIFSLVSMYSAGVLSESQKEKLKAKLPSAGYFVNYLTWRNIIRRKNKSKDVEKDITNIWSAVLEHTLKWLGQVLMADIQMALKNIAITDAILIPTGLIGLLPLHAASMGETHGEFKGFVSDLVNFTYAPSAYTIHNAQEHMPLPLKTIVTIDNPDGSLSYSTEEISVILGLLKPQKHIGLKGNEASLKKIKEKLSSANIIHISAHGLLSLDSPRKSGIKLANNQFLNILEINSLKFDITRLAVVSSCEVGLVNPSLNNEAISISTAFIEAGVSAVISSMWAVDSLSTFLLLTKFYELCALKNYELRCAFSNAQTWLRCSTTLDIMEFLKQFIPELSNKNLVDTDVSLRHVYWEISRKKNTEIPFSKPYFWAAFYYSGL
ncbi:MAG: hypothetical protein CVU44_10580 [Chloroflexi bacterium HGW-Chloroflexi-6]|nr:MAG: hypothetical protein CVU44_10580 [Chloroflexi bacterium HGW-Chloroflexi-6]